MRYLFLLYRSVDALPDPGTAAAAETFDSYMQVTDAMAKAEVLLDSAPLQPTSAATTVRVRAGEILITDGPAAEMNEFLGGYTIVECADLDEALRWAQRIPAAHDASVDVRPIVAIGPRR